MKTVAPACSACATPLPADAMFCHRCGARTPPSIHRETGEVVQPAAAAARDLAAQLQEALGDSCEVRQLLGRGGFAEVYVAYDKRLKREIAVKTLRADIVASPTMLERFQREAEAVAKLRHPNVVPIFSVGEGGGLAFYTMPLIEGSSLATILDHEGRLSVSEAVRILRDAAHALHAAHRAGIVHRDIKPDNIMLEGPERAVVVMDFGIARTTGDLGEKGLTGTGMLIGTPQYMSPEQATGDQAIDHRSDQYSLAMVGYRMLTGQLPFEHESVQTTLFKTVTEVPPPPHVIASDVPPELSAAIARALAKNPAERFASMADFAAAIGAVAGGGDNSRAVTARRRPRDMATRVREARERIPPRSRAIVAATIIAGIAAMAILKASTPRTFDRLTRERGDAVFAATALVNSLGPPQRRDDYARIIANDSVMRFLRKSMSFEQADARAANGIPVWEWVVVLPRGSEDVWEVWVGPNQRIRAFRQKLSDTLPGARISSDSARRIAAAMLIARGWNPASLRPLPDSTIQRRARTDHLVRWRADSISASDGKDTARLEVRATVAGDRVSFYVERFDVRSHTHSSGPAEGATVLLTLVAAIILCVGLAIRLSRRDQLQWLAVGRIVAAVGVLLLVPLIASLLRAANDGNDLGAFNQDPWQQVSNAVAVVALIAPFLICAGTVGESLAQADRPGAVAGFDDLSRGRFIIPEVIGPAVIGYAGGALILLVDAAVRWGALRFGSRASMPSLDGFGWNPVADQVGDASAGVLIGIALLFTLMVLRAWRWTRKVALILPAVVVALIPALDDHPAAITVVGVLFGVLVMCGAFWWGGFFAAVIATFIWSLTEPMLLALPAGGRYSMGGIVLLLVLLLPAVAALIARRRYLAGPADYRGGTA